MSRTGEDGLIARYFAPIAGEGALNLEDDAALIRPEPGCDLVVTVDALVGGVHFFPDDPPGSVAVKALAVNLSDLAAKGAEPVGFVLALALPATWTPAWLEAFAAGLGAAADRFGCPLLGGDTVRTHGPLTVAITAFGSVPQGRMVRRTGAEAGDRLYVSGTIGDAALGLRFRSGELPASWPNADPLRAALVDRYLHPQPRSALAPALRDFANGAMDVSDGLIGDAAKMAAASGVGGRIDLGQVPLSIAARAVVASDGEALTLAVTGGDDYEILAAVRPAHGPAFEAAAAQAGVPVTIVGTLSTGAAELAVFGPDGATMRFERKAFSHF